MPCLATSVVMPAPDAAKSSIMTAVVVLAGFTPLLLRANPPFDAARLVSS